MANPLTDSGSLFGCEPTATDGSGQLSSFVPTGGHVTWKNGTTTDYTTTLTTGEESDGAFPWPTGTLEFALKGSVTASTNASIPIGAPVKMEVCLLGTTKITNEPHTKVVL